MIFVAESSGQSIIVKFRSATTVASPSKTLEALADRYLSQPVPEGKRIYTTPIAKGRTPQVAAQIGLDRIVILPLKAGIKAEAAATALMTSAEIEWAEPNYIYAIDASEPPNDSLYGGQWSHTIMDVQHAWQTTKGDTSVKIGFVDTGVDWFHPDLVGQFAINHAEDINGNNLFDAWPSGIKQKDDRGVLVQGDLDGIDNDGNGYADDVIGYDFVDQQFLNFGDASVRDPVPNDEHSHGTSVAGVIGAKENNRIGVAGIAPGCRLVALRAFDATGNAEDDDIASAIIYAAENGVKILNLSFGDIWCSLLQRDAIRYAESKGCLVFASSGNRGGSGRHYPSDFDECVSVGATGPDDAFYGFTTTGENMDLVAPGADIITTTIGAGYSSVSGTSFSSPAAAAVAGLVLSKNPQLSPRELRSILASTTDDLFPDGYDHEHANGRIDARSALEYQGSASVKITSPATNDGFTIGQQIVISGSAVSTFFSGYSLSYAPGLNPDLNTQDESLWTPIGSSDAQTVVGPLGTWNTAGLAPGVYTLRLAVRSTNATKQSFRSTEERITLELKNAAPAIVNAFLDTMFIAEKSGLLAQIEADTLTYATLFYRPAGATQWSAKSDDRYSRRHAILLTTEDAESNRPYELLFVIRNSRGDTVSRTLGGIMPDIAVNERGFSQKSYALPLGFVLDTVIEASQGKTIVESVFPPGDDFGPVYTYSFDPVQKEFHKTDSTSTHWVPRDLGSIDGFSQDLMLQGGKQFLIYRGDTKPVLGSIIREDTAAANAFTALGFADPDGDKKDELVVIHQVTRQSRLQDLVELRSAQNNTFPLIAELPNPTSPAAEFRDNRYQKPDVRSKDLNGDGKDEIVVLDDDADLLVFSRDANGQYQTIAIDSNDGRTEGTLITIDDLNGDGKQDIAFAFHTSYDENLLGEYDPKYWTVKTLLGNGDGSFRAVAPLHFWNARSDKPYRSSLAAMKGVTDPDATELALSFFPDLYLFRFDQASQRMLPAWHYPVSISPRTGLAFDFDGNGIREFAVNTGDSIHFFERDYLLSERTPAPAGLEAIPRDINRVDLKWGAVHGATMYYIYRAGESENTFNLIDSASLLFYSDTTVTNLEHYLYSVIAFDPARTEPLSELALAVEAYVHPKPVVAKVTSKREFATVKVSQPLRQAELDGAGFLIDGTPCLTASISSDSVMILRTAAEFVPGTHELRVRTQHVRDRWNSPLDSGMVAAWQYDGDEPDIHFYIVKWHFEGNRRIAVKFNRRPADNALDVNRYTLSPYGHLLRAYRDDAEPNGIFIDLTNTAIVALGVPFVLCARDITDEIGTPIEKTEGNCAGISLVEPDLANIMAYPNPVHPTDEKLTFARLTAEAEISIYTADNRLLRRIRSSDRNGGLEWDLRDETGRELPSGVYLYHVTGKDENGNDVEPNEAKFVIIRGK